MKFLCQPSHWSQVIAEAMTKLVLSVCVDCERVCLLMRFCSSDSPVIQRWSSYWSQTPFITVIAAFATSGHTPVSHKTPKHVSLCCFITLSKLNFNVRICVWLLIKPQQADIKATIHQKLLSFVNVRLPYICRGVALPVLAEASNVLH